MLSGGGARGAYQVGIVRALVELGVEISAIAGASVGALNGAVVASSSSLEEASGRLSEIWRIVAEDPPIDGETPTLIRLLEWAGFRFRPVVRNAGIMARGMRQNIIPIIKSPETASLVDNSPITKLMGEYITDEALSAGIPLYVSVFPNRSMLETLIGTSLALVGIKDNPKSEFLCVQSLSSRDRRRALLASSAIPFLLQSQEIGGERYVDGGLGGLQSSQGNTPVLPLLEDGCDTVIVTTLSDRTRWSKQDGGKYAGVELFEIHRCAPIGRSPVLPDVFDIIAFIPENIYSWINQGYDDTISCLGPKFS